MCKTSEYQLMLAGQVTGGHAQTIEVGVVLGVA